jgi:hypothetical protein
MSSTENPLNALVFLNMTLSFRTLVVPWTVARNGVDRATASN